MYKLDVVLKITKEFLLSKNSQETYFEHYLGVPVKKGLFRSPPIIRADTNPTCSFYKDSKGNLKFKDFAGPSFDFIGCVMLIFNCNYYNALRIIAHDFGLINLKDTPKNPPKMQYTKSILTQTTKSHIAVEVKEFSKKELCWWDSFGVSLSVLEKFKVFSIKSVFLNGHYFMSSSESSPIYGYYGGSTLDKDELWRLYMPTKRNYRFLSNWSASLIQGAKQLPKSSEFIVITKSLKDVMSLYEFGVSAIAPNSENLFLTSKQYERLQTRFEKIFLLYDRDLPGIKAARKIKKNFPSIIVILIPKKYKCKDFTDFVKKYALLTTFKLLEEAKQYYSLK